MSGSASGPAVSVIVIAHDRRQFLRAAIESVLQQSVDPREREIVVAKNFPNESLDAFLAAEGVTTATGDTPTIGEKLSVAFERCRGRIIAFLEDDDLWRPGKVLAMRQAFDRNPRGTIYHNAFDQFGSRIGVAQPSWALPDRLREAAPPRGIPLRSMSRSTARQLLATSGLVNLSSFAVRREVLSQNLGMVRRIAASPEAIIFAAACRCGGRLLLDARPWTLYRKHAQSATALPEGGLAQWPQSMRQRMLAAAEDLLRAESSIPWPTPRRMIRMLRSRLELQRLLSAQGTDRLQALRLLGEVLSLADLATMPGTWMAGSFGLLLRYLVAPSWARKTYWERHPDRPQGAEPSPSEWSVAT